MSVKAARYARKIEKRRNVLALTTSQFLEDAALVESDIWELGYASTSDEDDNDEEEDSSEYDDEVDDEDSDDDEQNSDGEESKKAPS